MPPPKARRRTRSTTPTAQTPESLRAAYAADWTQRQAVFTADLKKLCEKHDVTVTGQLNILPRELVGSPVEHPIETPKKG